MAKRSAIKWKGVLLTIIGLGLCFVAYLLLTLFAIPATPIAYHPPPEVLPKQTSPANGQPDAEVAPVPSSTEATPTTQADEDIETLARNVLFEGQPAEQFVALFDHPDPAVREAAARALARCWAANMGATEPRAEGQELSRRYDLMEYFLREADQTVVLRALYEIVSKSVETGGSEFRGDDWQALYLLSGSWGLKSERAEILAWVANNHPVADMRHSAMFFLVNRDFDRGLGNAVLHSRASDPSFRVRLEALKQRFSRIVF